MNFPPNSLIRTPISNLQSPIPTMALKQLPNPLLHSPISTTKHHKIKASSNGSLLTQGSPGLRVAYQGSTGAYSELAAKTAFPSCTPVPCRSFSDAISAVHSSLADLAVLPVESTMDGSALRNYSLLLRHDLRVVQELNLFVHYCLLAMPGVSQAQLRKVISHPMALAHCARALARLGLRREAVEDTAGAVQMLRSGRLLDTAAIASPRAATIYGLDVLAHGIQDQNWNVTRFLLLSKPEPIMYDVPMAGRKKEKKKTSMVVAHRGGSMMVLLKVLSAFSSRNVNLTKLEANNPSADVERPPVMVLDVRGRGVMRSFSHLLYVDFEGSVDDDENVKDAIDEISKFSVFVRILGCYAADPNVYHLH